MKKKLARVTETHELILFKIETLTKSIEKLACAMMEHDKVSQMFREKTLACEADVSWIKSIGTWILGGSGLVGIVWAFVAIFFKS
jgi:hypothetical protein